MEANGSMCLSLSGTIGFPSASYSMGGPSSSSLVYQEMSIRSLKTSLTAVEFEKWRARDS